MPEKQVLIDTADKDGLSLGEASIPKTAIDVQWVQIVFYCVYHD